MAPAGALDTRDKPSREPGPSRPVDGREFYTWGSFLTLTVASGAVWVVAGAVSHAFEWHYPAYFPLAIAAIFSIGGDFAVRRDSPLASLLQRAPLWFLNACLIYTTAIGGAQFLAAPERPGGTLLAAEAAVRTAEELASLPGAGEVAEVQAVATQLRACLEGGDPEGCLEQHPLAERVKRIEPLVLSGARANELSSRLVMEAKALDRASKQSIKQSIGFSRLHHVKATALEAE